MIAKWELKKIMFQNKAIIVILAVLIFQFLLNFVNQPLRQHNYSEEIYKEYMNKMQGPYTEKKHIEIEKRDKEIKACIDLSESKDEQYKKGEISIDEYAEYKNEYIRALAEAETVTYILEKCEYYKMHGGNFSFFYDTKWMDYIENEGYNYLSLIFVLCFVIPIFDQEFSSNARSMLLTTRNGRNKTYLSKMIFVSLFVFGITYLLDMIRYFFFLKKYGYEYVNYGIKNLLNYAEFGNATLGQFCMYHYLLKAGIWMVEAGLLVLIVLVCKNIVFSFFTGIIVLVLPSYSQKLLPVQWIKYMIPSVNLKNIYSMKLDMHWLLLALVIQYIIFGVLGLLLWKRRSFLH